MSLAQRNGNDNVYTPDWLAEAIVEHYKPNGRTLDPCCGPTQAFAKCMSGCVYFDIAHEPYADFLATNLGAQSFDWVITNPPWSKFRAFLNEAMVVSDNVVFLSLVNAFFMRARMADMARQGFGLKEILFVPQPPKPWPQTGFELGATHIQRGWTGSVTINRMTNQ